MVNLRGLSFYSFFFKLFTAYLKNRRKIRHGFEVHLSFPEGTFQLKFDHGGGGVLGREQVIHFSLESPQASVEGGIAKIRPKANAFVTKKYNCCQVTS